MSDVEAVKPYKITFEYHPTYLHAHVEGTKYSYEIMMRYFKEIAVECREKNLKQVLVEEEISEITSMVDIFRTASELPQLGFTRIRLAFVDRFAEQKELNKFGLLVASNRGIDVQIFDTIAEADKWLSEKGKSG